MHEHWVRLTTITNYLKVAFIFNGINNNKHRQQPGSHKLFCFLGHTKWLGKKLKVRTPPPPEIDYEICFYAQTGWTHFVRNTKMPIHRHTGKCSPVSQVFQGIFVGHSVHLCIYRNDRTKSSLPLAIRCFASFRSQCFLLELQQRGKSVNYRFCTPVPPIYIPIFVPPCCLSIICVILMLRKKKINNTKKKKPGLHVVLLLMDFICTCHRPPKLPPSADWRVGGRGGGYGSSCKCYFHCCSQSVAVVGGTMRRAFKRTMTNKYCLRERSREFRSTNEPHSNWSNIQ